MTDEGCCATPPNDTCATAASYTVGSSVSGDTTCARADHAATCGGGAGSNDVAYVVTTDGAPRNYTFTMVGGSLADTVLHLHSSTACGTGDEVACSDDAGALNRSEFTVALPRGSFYLVADGFSTSNRGTFTLSSSSAAVNHGTCSTPLTITMDGTYTGTTSGRANDYNPTCVTSSAPDVVYRLTARRNGTITATTCGSSYDTALYVGTTCGGSNVACNDDSCGLQSSVSWSATAGTTYYIIVDGYSSNAGTFTLNITGL